MSESTAAPNDPLSPTITAEARRPCFFAPVPEADGLVSRGFELNSRGARVEGKLVHGLRPGDHLILVAHRAGEAYDCDLVEELGRSWASSGAVVASLDLPLHGRRRNPKLTPRLLETLAPGARRSPLEESLWRDYRYQALADLTGTLEAVAEVIETDLPKRSFVGFGLGAACGAAFFAGCKEVRRAVFEGLGRDAFPDALDPSASLEGQEDFMLVSGDDEPTGDARALAKALPGGQTLWYPGPQLPEDFAERALAFLSG